MLELKCGVVVESLDSLGAKFIIWPQILTFSLVISCLHLVTHIIIIIICQMWNLWLPVSSARISELAHEEAHTGGPLQLHLWVLWQEVRETGQCQIPQAKEPPRQAGDLRYLDTANTSLAFTGWAFWDPRKTSSEEEDFAVPVLSVSCPGQWTSPVFSQAEDEGRRLTAVQDTSCVRIRS